MVTKTRRLGVTLIELMFVVGIISALFAITAPLLRHANRTFLMTDTRLQLQREARAAMYVITRNLRQAQRSTITIGRANNNQPFYSKISFTKIQGGDAMTFQQEGTTLYQVINGTRRVISGNLGYLAFTFPRSDDMSIISVSMTFNKSMYEGQTKALHMASEKVMVMN